MIRYAPGDYVLFDQQHSSLPAWPAFVCTDDLAPKSVADARPNGYYHLILLIKQNLEFRYAMTTELHLFDPFPNPEQIGRVQGLQQAYDAVNSAIVDSESGLDYWRCRTQNQRMDNTSGHIKTAGSENDSDSDPDNRDARQRGRADMEIANCLGDIRHHFRLIETTTISDSSRNAPIRPVIPIGDIVDEEISDSKDFVEFVVGREHEQESFLIPYSEVKRRDYFSNPHHGYMRAKGDKAWTIDIPRLARISPKDFQYAADFLSTGDFGHRIIEDGNREEGFAQCAAAWVVGEDLGMEDLLDHIADKLKQVMPWTSGEVLALAIYVYQSPGTLLDGQEKMKGMLAQYVADNFYNMIEEHGENFTSRLQSITELARDAYQNMADEANKRLKG